MAFSEQSRHEMYQRLEEALGEQAAATLMEHLPPVGWADVATKRDLDVLRVSFEATEHRLRSNFRAELNAAITSQTRTLMFAIIGSNVTMAALAFAAASAR
ncbi:MAG: hypothetical protein M3144_06325 [Actinomycetota bacterium]|nr:hypothetical protein [Actinomycetota bacterium]